MKSRDTEIASREKPLRKKWGVALDPGFLLIPNSLLIKKQELGLGDGELVVLLNLLMAWWDEDGHPSPHTETIAKRMGVTARSVQRHLSRLEELGLIRRIGASLRARVSYDLAGTVARLQELTATMPTKPVSDLLLEESEQRKAL